MQVPPEHWTSIPPASHPLFNLPDHRFLYKHGFTSPTARFCSLTRGIVQIFQPFTQRCAGVRRAIMPGTPDMVCNHAKRDTSHQCCSDNSHACGTPGTDVSTKGEESIVCSDCTPCRRNLHTACIPRDTSRYISPLNLTEGET